MREPGERERRGEGTWRIPLLGMPAKPLPPQGSGRPSLWRGQRQAPSRHSSCCGKQISLLQASLRWLRSQKWCRGRHVQIYLAWGGCLLSWEPRIIETLQSFRPALHFDCQWRTDDWWVSCSYELQHGVGTAVARKIVEGILIATWTRWLLGRAEEKMRCGVVCFCCNNCG